MTNFETNLNAVKRYNPQLGEILASIPDGNFNTEPAKNGLLTLIYKSENQDFYIHSKFKPDEEAFKLVQKVNLEADHIILFGLGLGYHFDLIMTHKSPSARVLLIEPQLQIVKQSLKTLPWQQLLTRSDFFFCFSDDTNVLAQSVSNFLDLTVFDTLEIVDLPSEVRFAEAFFNTAREVIDNEIKTQMYDFRTRLAEDAMVPRNILKNIDGILHSRPVRALKSRFTGKPGFIVAAGPSLDRNILYLKKIQDRGVIMCVDTALKPLLKRGIHPHFVLAADPSYKNYLHLQGTGDQLKYFVVTDTGISTQVYDDFKGHIFSVSLGKPILKMIERNMGEIGELQAWGSVISMALHFAVYIGCDPITFMGQDFAYSDHRNHCRSTSWEDTWMEYNSDLGQMQRNEKASIGGSMKTVELPDIYGNATITSDKLMLYKNFLLKMVHAYPGSRFINATEGGIFTEIETRNLSQVLKEYVYPSSPIDVEQLFRIPTLYNPENKKKLLVFFNSKTDYFKKYKRKLESLLEKLKSADSLTLSSATPILEEAMNLKNQLYSVPSNGENGEIIEMWSQGPIYEFLKRYRKLEKHGLIQSNQKEWIRLFTDYFNRLNPMVSSVIGSFEIASQSISKTIAKTDLFD